MHCALTNSIFLCLVPIFLSTQQAKMQLRPWEFLSSHVLHMRGHNSGFEMLIYFDTVKLVWFLYFKKYFALNLIKLLFTGRVYKSFWGFPVTSRVLIVLSIILPHRVLQVWFNWMFFLDSRP